MKSRYKELFLLIFILVFVISGCNLFINLFEPPDDGDPSPHPTLEPPPYQITGLSPAGSFETGDAFVVVESGNYLYTAGSKGSPNNFCIIDFSNPETPQPRGSLSVEFAWGITANGPYVYIETEGGVGTVTVINCTDPMSPSVGNSETQGYNTANQIYYYNGYLFNCSGGLISVYDVSSDPETPSFKSAKPTNNAQWGAVSGNFFYVTENTNPGRMKIFDITVPANPDSLCDYATPFPYANGIAVSGNYAFIVFNNGMNTLAAFDTKNHTAPEKISDISLQSGTSDYLYEIKIKDNYLFVCGNKDLYVIDIHDPSRMKEVVSIPTSSAGFSWGFALSGDYAIVSDDPYYQVIHIDKEFP
jgi:hypothetical protein